MKFLLATEDGTKAITLQETLSKSSLVDFIKVAEGIGVATHLPESLR